MYGSVSRWRVRYRSDADPREYWVAGSWDSKDAYTANSNRPETDASFRRLRALIESDPEWRDGESFSPDPDLSGGGAGAVPTFQWE